MSATLLQRKMSFLIDDLLRDAHDRNKLPADTPAVVTTGFPRYCFAPVTLVSHSSCYDDVTESSNERGSLSNPRPCSPDYLGDVSRSDSDAESCRDSSDSRDRPEPLVKSTRTRPSFSAYQVQTLQSVFAHKHYLGKAERKQLSADLNMTDEQVKTWFQNKRTKLKKKMSRVDDHYANMLYLNELASGVSSEHLRDYSPPAYHSFR
ncbi:hypothetical protein QZH41_010515 [Actinostola sp. cb2023]|nr:hypothetical protein QZH41_010515 [Actinostola sp. cb2023]